MLTLLRRKYRALIFVVLCIAMLVVLARFQFVWIDQLSEAQEASMQYALQNSMRQFEQEIQRELNYLMIIFQTQFGARSGRGDNWSQFAARYSLWSRTTSYPKLLRRLLVYAPDESGEWTLHELPLGDRGWIPAEWDGSLEPVRDKLVTFRERTSRNRDIPLATWALFPQASAMVRSFARPVPGAAGGRRPPRRPRVGILMLIVDWSHVTEYILPGLVDQYFTGPNGDPLYEVAISAQGQEQVLYKSCEVIGEDWLENADLRQRMRLGRRPAARLQRATIAARGEALDGSPLADAVMQGPAGRRPVGLGRPRLYVVGPERPLELEVAAKHVEGSLAAVVGKQRKRNLWTGLGVLLVLASAIAMVLKSARRAEQLASMQMEFIAGVTHELRTPLSVVRSVGENLADGVVVRKSKVRQYGALIRDQGRRLSDMVEQTMQFAAMESGRHRYQFETLDAALAVQKAVDRARPMIEQAGFELDIQEPGSLPLVDADAKALQQILANLLSNAVKYGEPGRWVGVRARKSGSGAGSEVQVSVTDRGVGIPDAEAKRIFEAFYRGRATREQNVQGSGLGLKLARDLALGMGASLSFQSEFGEGSEFVLHLPVAAVSQDRGIADG